MPISQLNKRAIVAIIAGVCLTLGMMWGCSSGQNSSTANSGSSAESVSSESASAESAEAQPNYKAIVEGAVGHGTYYDSVRNDKTGNWRAFVFYSSTQAQDIAVDYYHAYVRDDKEIHALINLGLKTSTRLNISGNEISASVFEYVDGEEHDAVKMFSGQKLATYIINIETGEIEEV